MNAHRSPLEKLRLKYSPPIPDILTHLDKVEFRRGNLTQSISHQDELKQLFKITYGQPLLELAKKNGSSVELRTLKVGVVLSGGQAAGGHNVICGIFDALKRMHSDSHLIGFLNGPAGIVNNKYKEISETELSFFRNTGGFDLIGSGRTKIETQEQLDAVVKNVNFHQLDGLIIIGGDDSNTNAAILAEYFSQLKVSTKVIGVPKTIDGDLKNEHIETSFGFDTSCKIYSEMIGNICRDALSAKKYYHFIKLMGRSASHIALECAFQTHPNLVFIGEEVAVEKKSLKHLIEEVAQMVLERFLQQKEYGVILVPEGLLEFIPEIKLLISELNQHLCLEENSKKLEDLTSFLDKKSFISQLISREAFSTFESIPEKIQAQLLLERDPHGNVQVSHIETELLLMDGVKKLLKKYKEEGIYKGKFSCVNHFFGYEGRSAFPTNFDANYCYCLGHAAALLISQGYSGYMACVQNLKQDPSVWKVAGIPLTMLMHLEKRQGKLKPVIQKALVNLNGKPFQLLKEEREQWKFSDSYRYPGPIQYQGPSELCDGITFTLELESQL